MKNDSISKIENINEGDIYYFNLNDRYYVFQVLKIVSNLPTPYEYYKHGYFVTVFKKTFKNAPKAEDLDLKRIFVDKYYRKNTAYYFSIWNNKEASICCKNSNLKNYNLETLPIFKKIENRAVNSFDKFKPPLLPLFSFGGPAISVADYPNGIANYPEVIMSIDTMLNFLIEEKKTRLKKNKTITPKYFPEWVDYVNEEDLINTEKAISSFQLTEGSIKTKENSLKKCVEKINTLDSKSSHIGTIEREDIFEKLIEIAVSKEIDESEAENIINKHRTW